MSSWRSILARYPPPDNSWKTVADALDEYDRRHRQVLDTPAPKLGGNGDGDIGAVAAVFTADRVDHAYDDTNELHDNDNGGGGNSSARSPTVSSSDSSYAAPADARASPLAASLWPVHRVHHEKNRCIYEARYKQRRITHALYRYLTQHRIADGALIGKWRRQQAGYANLCSLLAVSRLTHLRTHSVCRVPLRKRRGLDALRPASMTGCVTCCDEDCNGNGPLWWNDPQPADWSVVRAERRAAVARAWKFYGGDPERASAAVAGGAEEVPGRKRPLLPSDWRYSEAELAAMRAADANERMQPRQQRRGKRPGRDDHREVLPGERKRCRGARLHCRHRGEQRAGGSR